MEETSLTLAPAPDPAALDATSADAEVLRDMNAWHERIARAADEATLCGALAGLALIGFRRTLEHGQWGAWVKANCRFSLRSATNYIGAALRAARAKCPANAALADEQVVTQLEDDAVRDDLRKALRYQLELADDATRQRFIEAIRRPVEALPPVAPKPAAKARSPRPPVPPERVALRYATKIAASEPAVKVAVFTSLRPEFEAWLEQTRTAELATLNA